MNSGIKNGVLQIIYHVFTLLLLITGRHSTPDRPWPVLLVLRQAFGLSLRTSSGHWAFEGGLSLRQPDLREAVLKCKSMAQRFVPSHSTNLGSQREAWWGGKLNQVKSQKQGAIFGPFMTHKFISQLAKAVETSKYKYFRDTLDTASCLGYPPGPESATLEQLERWLFWGFLFCHSVVDVGKSEGGEYQVSILPIIFTPSPSKIIIVFEKWSCFRLSRNYIAW